MNLSDMKLNEKAAGVYIISATPFTETGAIDYASADQLVDFYLERGVTGMTILGTVSYTHLTLPTTPYV